MFIDKVDIYVKAGNGGNGSVSFRREKFVPAGGPDGGDGGKGGDIVFVIDKGENTLLSFKKRRKFVAQSGDDGTGRKFKGKNGEDIIISVPQGTVIRDRDSGEVIQDMSDETPFTVARGGKGGWGNTHFATSTRQAPRFAKSGLPGEERHLTLELKMLADVGIVGYPNVGKSTLLSIISAATPKIANYHFTTLSPVLGVVKVYDSEFVVADIPGLIEGASEGIGLGHDFLRHIDRCRLILHLFDLSASERSSPLEDIKTINTELYNYSPELASRPQILAGTKSDLGYDQAHYDKVADYAKTKSEDLHVLSSATGEGVKELISAIALKLKSLPPIKTYESSFILDPAIDTTDKSVDIEVVNDVYHVTGEWLQRLLGNINFDDHESMQYFQRVLRKNGVIDALEKAGIDEGKTVDIYGLEFDFYF